MPGSRRLLLAHEADVRHEALHVERAPEIQLPVLRLQRRAPDEVWHCDVKCSARYIDEFAG